MSSIDHGFCNKPEAIKNYGTIMTEHYSDHNLIHVELQANVSRKCLETFIARDMRKIRSNPQYFINSLMKVQWAKMADMVNDVDEMEKFFTDSVISCLDETAPVKERKLKLKQYSLPRNVKMEKQIRDNLFYELNLAKKEMEEHKKVHGNSTKPFSCSRCDHNFEGIAQLKEHLKNHNHDKTHTSEKLLKCTYNILDEKVSNYMIYTPFIKIV